MNLAELWAEIEYEYSWRDEEIRFLENCTSGLRDEESKKRIRRATILMLYAHLEGFCVFSFRHFIRAINSEKIAAENASFAIAAAACSKVFAAMRDSNTKCELFQNALPDDSKLHRIARDQEFVERIAEVAGIQVELVDDIIDTESNLKPVVLRKNLFLLGLPNDAFKHLDGTIHRLLNLRNKIAHGERKDGIDSREFNVLKHAVREVMRDVKSLIMKHLADQTFLRAT